MLREAFFDSEKLTKLVFPKDYIDISAFNSRLRKVYIAKSTKKLKISSKKIKTIKLDSRNKIFSLGKKGLYEKGKVYIKYSK